MALPRFYCPLALHPGQRIALPDDLAHHAVRVLRLRHGADLILFTGQGGEYPAQLVLTDGQPPQADILAHDNREAELHGHITLVQGLPSGDKMDWVIEKAVETGVSQVSPIAAQRSVLQLTGNRLQKRLQHWHRVAQAASEQCGRNRLMPIAPPVTLQAYLQQHLNRNSLLLFCDPDADQTLPSALSTPTQAITLLVGPEGGWSPQEQALALEHGAQAVRFGPRVLRTETASIALVSAIAALQGWNP